MLGLANSRLDKMPRDRPDMVTIAETIIERRSGAFDPASSCDRYQDALRELVEAKMRGLKRAPSHRR